jgi:hypothetical protein
LRRSTLSLFEWCPAEKAVCPHFFNKLLEPQDDLAVENSRSFVQHRLQQVSVPARKLFEVIVREAYHGPLRSKAQGTATPPEILEACGLDVGEFYGLLDVLKEAGLIQVLDAYPFEEIQLTAEAHRECS